MAIKDQVITDRYALYLGDCIETMAQMPTKRVHLSVYSPPFCGLYQYSSDERDLSNNVGYREFFGHYEFVVKELARVTMPGRMTAVHCMDIPGGNANNPSLVDFPGDIIRMHERLGWSYAARYSIWKEPLAVRMRTMIKGLAHQTIIEDSSRCVNAGADYLLVFRRAGENKIPIEHPTGFLDYAGSRTPSAKAMKKKGWTGKQIENSYSHWIWRQYASAFWDDVRLDRTLPFMDSRDDEDERHVHPLQLDVIDRCLSLWSNPGEVVLTPFMGVGSEVYSAVRNGRKGVGIELKPSYFRQAVKNLETAGVESEQGDLFGRSDSDASQVVVAMRNPHS